MHLIVKQNQLQHTLKSQATYKTVLMRVLKNGKVNVNQRLEIPESSLPATLIL